MRFVNLADRRKPLNRRRKTHKTWDLFALLFTSSVWLLASGAALAQTTVFFNEIHYDNVGTDAGEAIEIAGPAGTSLTGWSIVLYNGADGLSYNTTALSGTIPNLGGTGFGVVVVTYAVNGIQNGAPDGMALVNGATVVQFLSYEGTFTALNGPATGMTSVNIGVFEGGSDPAGRSLQLSGTGSTYENFTWQPAATSTFGAFNTGQTFVPADAAPMVDGTSPTNGATGVALDANITINFSEPVTVTGAWFTITGSLSLGHGATVSGGPTSFTLDPTTDFVSGETVTVTVVAANVSDNDTNDPPDKMAANFTFSFATIAPDAPPTVTSTFPSNGAAQIANDTDITITFSEPVNVSGSWFSITGASSGPHAAMVSGGPASFTLNPDADFVNSELVTVTIFAANVSDQDTNDPPDNMAANFTFSFRIVSPMRINELNSDTPGTDALEFVELYDGGAGNTSLDGLVVVFYNGANDLSYAAFDLDGKTTNAAGFFLMGNSGVLPAPGLTFAGNLLQNGADAVALYFGNATDFPTGTPVTTANLIDAVVYDTDDADDAGLLVLLNSGQPQVNEGTHIVNTLDQAIARVPDGGVARNTNTYVQQMPTPGGTNVLKEIFAIQGSGLASPFANKFVGTKDNVVTAKASNGFFIQTPTARTDNDAQTSDGIFVFTSIAPTVNVGDVVNVYGQVIEFFNFTEYSNNPTVAVVSSGNSLPAPVQFDAFTPSPNQPQSATEYERFEGMRIEIASGVVAGPNQFFNSDPIAEVHIVAGPNRPFREPGIEFPGLPGLPVWDGNPEVFELDPDRLGLPNLAIPAGSTFSGTGVLGFEFSGYEFWPTSLTVTSENALPRAVRARNTGESTIATLNMFRFFDDVNDPPSQDVQGRTRDDEVVSTAEYGRRRAKLARYILEVLRAPDILAVQEAEKKEVLDSLAADIKQLDGAVAYSAFLVEGNDVGTIDVGFLVRNTVTVNSVMQLGKTDMFTFDGSLLHDRPPLLLDANLADGCAISVLCVHQRSLGGIDDPVDGNRVRQKRHAQAVSVANMVQSLQTGKPFINLVVTGDFNAFQFTDGYVDVLGQIMGTPADASQALIPGTDVVNPDLTNQVLALPEAERYSFNFGGSAQVLDHMLVSQTLNPAITGRAYARGNSDAAVNFINDGSTVLRASDHDGLVLYITPIPVIADAGADQEICSGASTTIGGSPTGAGGAGTLTFSWSPTTGLDDPTKANPTVTLTATTTTTLTYTVTVTDANNCKATDEATVTVNPLPNAAAGADLSICFAQTVKLGGNPTGSGGTGALTFSWTAAPADPSLSDPSAANPTARPAATTTYTVEVTDAKGCKATDQITVTVHRFVLLSDGYIRFNQNKISSGDIHSNKKIEFGVGAPGTHTGNLTALDDITIRNKNTIAGNATANDELYLFGNATVTGAKIDHANLPPVVLSPVAFAAGGPNKTVPPNGAMSLAPGSYGTVQVGEKATLLLSAGDYFMKVLDTDPAAILSINVADGPVNVHVTKDLCFDERVKVKITGAGAATDKVTFITLQDPKVDVGKRATIQGTLIAQNSQVHFSNGCKVKGAVCADDGISVDAGVTFNFHSPGVLAKFADEESEAGESEAVTSYQLEQNYPNPFNPSTQIKFSVLEAGVVHLSVYNLQGQLVRTLVSGEMNPGHHAITWNGRDDGGRLAPSGVYLYKLRVNGFEKTRKMTLMK